MVKPWVRLIQILIVILVPVVIVTGSIRLLATDQYLAFEYGKGTFPADPFGFSPAQRYQHAAANIRYVRDQLPIAALSEQEHAGNPLYNARELGHMIDVQTVYQIVWLIGRIAALILLVIGLYMIVTPPNRLALTASLKAGGLITAGIVALIGLLALFAWQLWFLAFHEIFFPPGSWTFNISDTLIRLFPETFWFDAATTIAGICFLVGMAIWAFSFLIGRKLQQRRLQTAPAS